MGLAAGELKARQDVSIDMERPDGTRQAFVVTARLDTPVEINYYRNGGILQTVLRKMLSSGTAAPAGNPELM